MRKRLAQIVSLMLAIACVLNAQCVVACTLVSTGPASQSAPTLDLGKDHACCPHHRGSSRQAPCPQTAAHGSDTQIEIRNVAVVRQVLPAIPAGIISELIPLQTRSVPSLRPGMEFPAPNLPPSITALRI
jgi:hypothetical protein